jgi:hypothetical protein
MKKKDDTQTSFDFDRSPSSTQKALSNVKPLDRALRIVQSGRSHESHGATANKDVYSINKRILDLIK